MKPLILILSLSYSLSAIGQNPLDSGFTNKSEAKNLIVNGKKEGKWLEFLVRKFVVGGATYTDTFGYKLLMYKDGKPFGMVRGYNLENGRLHSETPYSEGKGNGIEKIYDENGKLGMEIPLVNDSINGIEKLYDVKNGIQYDTPYINGKKNGIAKGFYKSGKLMYSYPYTNGVENGVFIDYYENGNIEFLRPFTNGKVINDTVKHFFDNGLLEWEMPYGNDKPNGVAKDFYMNGKLKSQTIYTNGVEGITTSYDPKGKVTRKSYDELGNEIK